MKDKKLVLLFIILILAAFLRLYRLDQIPPSLSWDEAAVGYDGWSVSRDGKDQWGNDYPLIFQSFGEYKSPFHIYAAALSIKALGLSDLAVRLPLALLGVVNIVLVFLVAKMVFKNFNVALGASFLMALSPWHIQFSRVAWETNFTLAFFFAGLIFFIKGVGNPRWLVLSFLLFGLDLYTYNAPKIFIPFFIISIIFIYNKVLFKQKRLFLAAIGSFVLLSSLALINPQTTGLGRLQQVGVDDRLVYESNLFNFTQNFILGRLEVSTKQYLSHFSPQFLLFSGDYNPRHSIQMIGELYWFELIFMIVGVWYLFRHHKKDNMCKLLLVWFFLAPLPAAFFGEAPHASRSMFALGGWQIIAAFGGWVIYQWSKKYFSSIKILFISFVFVMLAVGSYVYEYFIIYPKDFSKDWQYGYKEATLKYKDSFSKFDQVVMTERYNQPYIFVLYYSRYDPVKFRNLVQLNSQNHWSVSTVKGFDKFIFSVIDFYNFPKGNSLIFAHPSEKLTEIKESDVIYNKDGTVALYVYQYQK